MDTTYATSDGEPLPACRTNFGAGVWFSFRPPSDGPALISTCGSGFDTILQVFTGTCDGLTPVVCGDDSGPACATNQASVSFFGSAQTNYLILVGGYAGATGHLSITATRAAPPSNQNCSGAIAMAPDVPYGGNTFDAASTAHPVPTCQPDFGHPMWYTFTPPLDGLVSVSTCGSDFDTVLQVFTGACGALSPLAGGCNDDGGPACDSVNASVYFMGQAGVKYWLLAGGYGTNWGNLELTAAVVPPISTSWQNDSFVLSWPTNVGLLNLEYTTNLSPPMVWQPWYYWLSPGSNYTVSESAFGPQRFFRLRP